MHDRGDSRYRSTLRLLEAGLLGSALGLIQGLLLGCIVRAGPAFPGWAGPALILGALGLFLVLASEMWLDRPR